MKKLLLLFLLCFSVCLCLAVANAEERYIDGEKEGFYIIRRFNELEQRIKKLEEKDEYTLEDFKNDIFDRLDSVDMFRKK